MNDQIKEIITALFESGTDVVLIGSGNEISGTKFEAVRDAAAKLDEAGLSVAIINFR